MGAFISAGVAANSCRVPCYKRTMTVLPDMTEAQIRRYARHIVLAEIGGVIFNQGLTESVDAAKRRSQIVGDGVAEGFQLFVRQFK